MRWDLISGEYPPALGGVGAYSHQVAAALAAVGDQVRVSTPGAAGDGAGSGIAVHHLPDHFGARSLAELSRAGAGRSGGRILLQYVPQSLGMRGMNLPLCIWLLTRRRAQLDVMFHEVAYPMAWRQPMRRNLFGAVTRVMAALAARSAGRIFVAIPAWEKILRRYVPRHRPIRWLPVPSNIPVMDDPEATLAVRRRYASAEGPLLGHFGTYGAAIAKPLGAVLELILRRRPGIPVLLLGHGGAEFLRAFLARNRDLTASVAASGELALEALSFHLAACDLMIQPYPDGISTRRTSAMASLAHRRAVATTRGRLTEPLWSEAGAAALAPAGDGAALADTVLALLADSGERARLESAGRALYDARFDLRHTIAALREDAGSRLATRR